MVLNNDPLLARDNNVTAGKLDLRLGTCGACKYGIFKKSELRRSGVNLYHSYCLEESTDES